MAENLKPIVINKINQRERPEVRNRRTDAKGSMTQRAACCTELKGKASSSEDKSEDIQKEAWRDEGRGDTERRAYSQGGGQKGKWKNVTETIFEKKVAENFT